ncbi:hypothetical protein [Halostella salina]|uniref:hypothetical protein n=1 Tax=Halostella salina TaxID=1547897 RepID=UPI000EF7EA17|nr:hypothetical protein [Halostella salina]
MVETKLINVLILWFVAATFLQTSSGSGDGPLLLGMSFLALGLLWAIPAYFVVRLFGAVGALD